MADPTLLTVTKTWDGTDWTIHLAWNDGDGPFTVSYSPDPSFQNGVKTLEKGTDATSTSVTANPGKTLEMFDVAGQTALSSAAQGLGYDPEPFPTVSATSGTSFWWGNPITFTGTYMDSIPKANIAYMMDLPVRAHSTTVSGTYATGATFTIPDDARGFWSIVQSHGRSSDYGGSSYVPLYAPGVGPFTAVYGINYVPSNGRFWLAADGAIQQLDLFRQTPGEACTSPACPIISGLVKPYISRVTSEATPKFLYVDGTLGVTSIRKVNAETGLDEQYAMTHDTGFTRNIQPVGIAVDPDGSTCYIADGASGRIVKIPANAGSGSTIVDTWGGAGFSFPDPCGIDVNLGHQVAVAHTNGYIYYIYGQFSYTFYGYAGGQVHSMHFDKDYADSSDTYLFWSNELAMTEAFNKNEMGSDPAHYHGGIVFGLSNGHIDLEPDWNFYVYRHFPQRVVLNNAGQSTEYPTAYQNSDRIIEMQMTGWAGRKVQLRVIDPPDLSAYVPDGGCLQGGCSKAVPYEANDNVGSADYGVTTNADGTGAQVSDTYTIDNDGTLTFYLKVPERYSGDNFQVEVTKCDYAGNVLSQRVASMSPVYTSWKRVYVEKDKMFRRGGLLYANFAPGSCSPNCNQITVFDWTNASVGDEIVVFDETHTYENGGEKRTITGIGSALGGTRIITLNATLSNYYYATDNDGSLPPLPTFANGHSGGFGVIHSTVAINGETITDTSPNQSNGTGSAFYDADMRDIEQPFNDAYVELVGLRSGMGAVPYVDEVVPFYDGGSSGGPESSNRINFEGIWSLHGLNTQTPNYIYLLGCKGRTFAPPELTAGISDWPAHYSYIYLNSLGSWGQAQVPPFTPAQTTQAVQYDCDHEFGHQFRTNRCTTTPPCSGAMPYHDDRSWWDTSPAGCPASNPCLEEYSLPNPPTGVNRFCNEDLLLGDPNCSGTSIRPGAVRTYSDPLP